MPKRALSLRQAQNCENALHPTCKCRCGGALHGAKRGGDNPPTREFFMGLDEGDPHYVKPKKERWIQLPMFPALGELTNG